MNVKEDSNSSNKRKGKIPFAVFISPVNKNDDNVCNYKEIFTDIISDRIKQKYR